MKCTGLGVAPGENVERISHLIPLMQNEKQQLKLHYGDMTDRVVLLG